MPKTNEWRPRLSINISQKQFKGLQRYIPWGVRGQVFSVIIDDLLEAIKDKGPDVIGALISRKIKYQDLANRRDDVESF